MADPLQPGAVFAGHRIEGLAGRGGMGVVYRATHLALDHVVALKVISPDLAQDERFRRRFGEESRIAVSIRHPNVVAIHHAGEEDGLLFVTMDLIDGTDLRGLLHVHGRMSPEHAVSVIGEVASALDAAHARGLVHRDIKPGNILIEGDGASERVYLTDFGLARQIEASTGVTATGAFVGTLDYVAPEQIRGERVDARADVYALGCVFYELLTGMPPFAAREDKVAKMYAHIDEEPPRVRVTRPELTGELDLVLMRALAKSPEDRYPSAGDFARAAASALKGQETVEAERSVAIGAAAPGPREATTTAERVRAEDVASDTSRLPSEAEMAEPSTSIALPPERPPSERRGGRGPTIAVVAGLLVVAVAAIALILGGGGDSDDDGPATTGQANKRAESEPATPSTPTATIDGEAVPVGQLPVNLVHGEKGLYVTNRKGNTVSFVDGDPAKQRESFDAGSAPEGIAEGDGSLWVSSGATDTLLRLEPETGDIQAEIPVGDLPGGVAFADGSVWVANSGSNTVSRIDPSGSETREIAVGAGPYWLTTGEGYLWVSNRGGDSVTRISLNSSKPDEPIAVGRNPKGIAFADGKLWVANTDDDTVSVVDSAKQQDTIDVGSEPRGVVAAFGSIWVANGASDDVSRIDPATGEVAQTIEVDGSGPEGIAAGPRSVWVANGASDDLTRIDPGVEPGG